MKGIELKAIILANGHLLGDIADKIGESQQNFSAFLKSDNLKSGLLERVAEAMGVTVGYLYGEGSQVANANGDNSTAIAGNNIQNSECARLTELLAQKEEQLRKTQEQMDKLIDILQNALK